MDELGAKFWLSVVGVALAIGLGGMIIFLVLGAAWYAWGPFIALIVVTGLLALAGWIYDRMHDRPYDDAVADR